jgi:hypothetical protein
MENQQAGRQGSLVFSWVGLEIHRGAACVGAVHCLTCSLECEGQGAVISIGLSRTSSRYPTPRWQKLSAEAAFAEWA